MTLAIKPTHILDAEKMAQRIYLEGPKKQQEMLERISITLIDLTSEHLQILKK